MIKSQIQVTTSIRFCHTNFTDHYSALDEKNLKKVPQIFPWKVVLYGGVLSFVGRHQSRKYQPRTDKIVVD